MPSSPQGIEIVRFEPAQHDVDSLHDTAFDVQNLLHGVLVEHYQESLGLPVNTDMHNPNKPEKVIWQRVSLSNSGSLEPEGGVVYWLARDTHENDKVVGICKLRRIGDSCVNIDEFDVMGPGRYDRAGRGYRGQGIGRLLLARAANDPDILRGDSLSLEVVAGNPARRLYESLGFVSTGETNQYGVAFRRVRGQPPVLFERMISSPRTVIARIQATFEQNSGLDLTSETPTIDPTSNLEHLTSTLGGIALEHIPSTVGGIDERIEAIRERIASIQSNITESNRRESEARISTLQQAVSNLEGAANVLSQGNNSVTDSIGGYVEEVGGEE